MTNKKGRLPPLEEGLLTALQAIDSQIAREMQRDPGARDIRGVQKWEPFEKRIERVTGFVLDQVGDDRVKLDSVLVLSQALAKSLSLLVDELGREGLGEVRSGYCLVAAEALLREINRIKDVLGGHNHVF